MNDDEDEILLSKIMEFRKNSKKAAGNRQDNNQSSNIKQSMKYNEYLINRKSQLQMENDDNESFRLNNFKSWKKPPDSVANSFRSDVGTPMGTSNPERPKFGNQNNYQPNNQENSIIIKEIGADEIEKLQTRVVNHTEKNVFSFQDNPKEKISQPETPNCNQFCFLIQKRETNNLRRKQGYQWSYNFAGRCNPK